MTSLDVFRDAVVINVVSFCTSLYAGFAVFSIIGYMAHEYGVPIQEVIKSGESIDLSIYLSFYQSIYEIFIAPLQCNCSEALPAQSWNLKIARTVVENGKLLRDIFLVVYLNF